MSANPLPFSVRRGTFALGDFGTHLLPDYGPDDFLLLVPTAKPGRGRKVLLRQGSRFLIRRWRGREKHRGQIVGVIVGVFQDA